MTSDLPSSLARPASENEAENRALRNRTRPLGILNRLKREWAHQKIAQEPDRLAAIVESSDDAIISKDLNGIIKTWNAGAELIFGFTAAEAIGQPITILIPPERQHEDRGILDRIRQGERIYHYETVRRRKDGTLLDISLTVSPLKNSEGRIVGISKIARDITERKKSESALREAKEELARSNEDLEKRVQERTASLREAMYQMEEFSYSVSHDLRAPIRAMIGYARAVLDDSAERLDAQSKEYLERIIRSGARMDKLTQEVLTYSRLSRGEMKLQPVSLEQLVHEVIVNYPETQPPRAEVVVRSPLSHVIGHEPSLMQAVSNLLVNAVKFMPQGKTPEVQVWTETKKGSVRLWIQDNGIGIKPEDQHRIFGMFERVHTNGNYEGTGIGLAIVRKAVEKMGGTVGVESDGKHGSKFWIQLPSVAAS